MTPSAVGFIFARGGSKGITGKNIRPFLGKPLIAHAIQAAAKSRFIIRVIVSTDDDRIAQIARDYGAEVPFIRPAELSGDTSSEWLAWQHAIREVQKQDAHAPGIFVSIPATSPLRLTEDIDVCIAELVSSDADIVITVKKAERSPYFNMVKLDEDGYARIVVRPPQAVERRQDSPAVYDMTTVAYAAWPEFILRSKGIFDGKVRTVEIPRERAVDIDTELDFKIAEFLARERVKKKGKNR